MHQGEIKGGGAAARKGAEKRELSDFDRTDQNAWERSDRPEVTTDPVDHPGSDGAR